MELLLKRYTWGMFGTEDKRAIAGSERVVASTSDITDDMKLRVRTVVRTGLDASDLKHTDAYGFFPLGDDRYIACHYQVSPVAEPRSRGEHLFVEYIWIEREDLQQLGWNLVPIFRLFNRIDIYTRFERQPHFKLDTSATAETQKLWIDSIRLHPVLLQAALVRVLSSDTRLEVISAPSQDEQRMLWACGFLQCLPHDFRPSFSFCTLSNPPNSSARLIFPTRSTASEFSLDWQSPGDIRGSGAIYAGWIAEIVSKSPDSIQREVASLRLPRRNAGNATRADSADLAVRCRLWLNTFDRKRIESKEALVSLLSTLDDYESILDEGELTEWLGVILWHALVLREYATGVKALARYGYLLQYRDASAKLVDQVLDATSGQDDLGGLAQLVIQIDTAGAASHASLMNSFGEAIVSSCWRRNLPQGLLLWNSLPYERWGRSSTRMAKMVRHLESINVEDLPDLLEAVSRSASEDTFVEACKLAERSSPELKTIYPGTVGWLQCVESVSGAWHDSAPALLLTSYREIMSPMWLVSSVRLLLARSLPVALPLEPLSHIWVDLLRKPTDLPVVESVGDLLVRNPTLVRATPREVLGDLTDTAIQVGAVELATLCFTVAIERRFATKKSCQGLLRQYRRRFLSMNAVRVLGQLAREYPSARQMTLGDLHSWIDFNRRLLDQLGTEVVTGSDRLATAYVNALYVYACKRRQQDIENLFAVLSIGKGPVLRSLQPSLLRLMIEILQAYDTQSWERLSQCALHSEELRSEYRKIVQTACGLMVVDDLSFPKFLQMEKELRISGRIWEAGILVFALLQTLATPQSVSRLAVPLGATLISVNDGDISLTEMGEWIDDPGFLSQTDALNMLCREMVSQDIDLAKQTEMASSSILQRHSDALQTISITRTIYQDPVVVARIFVQLIARSLHLGLQHAGLSSNR